MTFLNSNKAVSRWGAGIILAGLLFLGACQQPPQKHDPDPPVVVVPTMPTVQLAGQTIRVRIASTPQARELGLGGVRSLAVDEGMLFIYPTDSSRSFWMKGCLIPLDIFFLDSRGRILSVHTMPIPKPGQSDENLPRADSRGQARYVLEVDAGFSRVHGVVRGDVVDLGSLIKKARF